MATPKTTEPMPMRTNVLHGGHKNDQLAVPFTCESCFSQVCALCEGGSDSADYPCAVCDFVHADLCDDCWAACPDVQAQDQDRDRE